MDKLKEALVSSPVLAYFDVNTVATDLYCDASGDSIGEVLQQTDKNGEVCPVCIFGNNSWVFLSRYTLTTATMDS